MGRPMPAEVRAVLRTVQHPARAVQCPHCHAAPHRPCTTVSGRRHPAGPHDSRVTAWAVATACCPACQVEPGTPCHHDGRPLPDPHPQRTTEARRTAA